jgi:CTP synthase
VACIYELPLALHAEGIDEKITESLNIWARQPDLGPGSASSSASRSRRAAR